VNTSDKIQNISIPTGKKPPGTCLFQDGLNSSLKLVLAKPDGPQLLPEIGTKKNHALT